MKGEGGKLNTTIEHFMHASFNMNTRLIYRWAGAAGQSINWLVQPDVVCVGLWLVHNTKQTHCDW